MIDYKDKISLSLYIYVSSDSSIHNWDIIELFIFPEGWKFKVLELAATQQRDGRRLRGQVGSASHGVTDT